MGITYDPEANRLRLTPRHGPAQVEAKPFYLQLCPFCREVLRAYFAWPQPVNAEACEPDRHRQCYNGFHHDGIQAVVQRIHSCSGGQAFHALSLAFSLDRIMREKLFHCPPDEGERLEELCVAAGRLATGEVDPVPFVLITETVRGQDRFLALPHGALPLAETPPSGSSWPHRDEIIAAFLPWLEKVLPGTAAALKGNNQLAASL